jgi:hypothetical protein
VRRCSYRGRRTSKHHDRTAGSMSAMRPGEPADEPFLRVVRRSAEEQRATCHAPGAQPRPDRSRMALQARSRGQGASGGCGGPGRRGRPSWLQRRIGTEERSSLRAVRGVGSASRGISSVRAWKRSSSRHGRIPTAWLSRGERFDRSSPQG